MIHSLREGILRWAGPFISLPVAGLDISDRSMKYLQFDFEKRARISAYGELEIPEGLIAAGEIKDETLLAEFLKKWIAKEPNFLRSAFFCVSLPEEKSFLRVIELPKIKREDAENAIRWEIEGNVPLPLEDIVYDYEIMDPLDAGTEDHFDAVLTAFPKAIVESYTRVLANARINVHALELESQAVVRSTIKDLRKKEVALIVEMGRFRTSFIIVAAGTIIFTSTIEFGGVFLEQNIARVMNIDMKKADEIKERVGLNKREYEGKIFSALVGSIAVLADELKRAIEYYEGHAKHAHGALPQVGRILIAGGEANLPGLDTLLASLLKIPVERADPFAALEDRFAGPLKPLPKKKALAFATAIGLALRGNA